MNFGDFTSMFAKMKETFTQTFNIKSINKEIKSISELFLSLTKNDNQNSSSENDYGKYELLYDQKTNSDNIVESNNILYLALVSFHQKKGSVIELTYPPMEQLIKEPNEDLKSLIEKDEDIETIIKNMNSQIINYSLMDGIHLVDNDTQIYLLNNMKKPIYCLSYYVQVKTGNGFPQKEDSFQENVRECIQKALCIVSLKPFFNHKLLYQYFYTYLTLQMNSFMEQESLNDKSKLNVLYNILSKNITLVDLNKDQYLFNIRKLFCLLKNDIITILKLILCEQNIVIFSQIPSNVSLFIISILSILPGEICQELSNYDVQNGMPFKILHENYLIYPLFTLFDLNPLIEKLKNNSNFHYICGTTNFLVPKSKDINYTCFINVDELTVTYNENLNENLIYINSYEKKIADEINKKISNNISTGEAEKNYEFSKRCNINEEWIISSDNCKKEIIREYDFIIKKLREYFLNIAFDSNYLLTEISEINKNNDQNKAQIALKEINEEINKNYLNYISQSKENLPDNGQNNINNNQETPKKKKKENLLPRIDEVISEPYIYLLNSKLLFSINNQIDMGLTASPANTEIPKDLHSPLSDLNNLTFISFWLKTKNFKKWINSIKNDSNITKLSQLNITKALVSKLYDYDNNEYDGYMRFGKRNGSGKISYVNEDLTYVGTFKNNLKDGRGNISSSDNQFLYEGDWKNDKYEGMGTLVSPKEGKYIGEFKDGIYEGKGYLIDNDKNIYNGSFKNGKKCGEGELNMINGEKYIGMFKDNKYNGKGKFLDSKGNIIQEGVFKDGEFVPPKNKKDKEDNEKSNGNINQENNENETNKEPEEEKKE